MAKPICVIYFPEHYISGNNDRGWIYDYMRSLNGGDVSWIKWHKEEYFTEYYWFCFWKPEIEEPEFKVFYEKDFDEVKFEELKQMIKESIDQQKNQ